MLLFLRNILLILGICQILPTSLSLFVGPEDDLEGSHDLEVSEGGSGVDSVDLSSEENNDDDPPKKLMTATDIRNGHQAIDRITFQEEGEPRFKSPGDSDLMIAHMAGRRPAVLFSQDKLQALLKSKEVIAGAVAGGVVGVMLAAAVVAVRVYKSKMEDVGYTLGKKT